LFPLGFSLALLRLACASGMAEGVHGLEFRSPPTWIVNRLKRDPKNQRVKFHTPS
jgi:hypothetical protein